MCKYLWPLMSCSVFLIVFSGCASLRTTQGRTVDLRVYIFECGQNDVADLSLFAPGIGKGIKKKLTVSCYLIQHKKGNLLWDSGLSDEIAKLPDGITKFDGKFHLQVKKPFLQQLAEIGVFPSDIKYAAFSHFHADHVGNANAFKDATLLVQIEEYAAAFGSEPEKYGFDPKVYEHLKDSKVIKLNGDYDVFGDGSVLIKRAIGHTPGHQVLFVDLPKTGPVVISGDLYHFTDNRIHRRVPSFNFDKAESKKSMTNIENFIENVGAEMWIQHDFEQHQTLKHAPNYYD